MRTPDPIDPALRAAAPDEAATLQALGVAVAIDRGPCGLCPVEAEGSVDGRPWYYRSRGTRTQLAVAATAGADPDVAIDVSLGYAPGFCITAIIAAFPHAGYIPDAEALGYLARGLVCWALATRVGDPPQ